MRDGEAEVRCRIAPHIDFYDWLVRLDAGVQINQTGNAADFFADESAQALQFFQVGPLQGKLDLLVAAHRVEQADVRHGDARHLFEPLAQHARKLVDTDAARLAINQAHIDIGVNLALRVAGVDSCQGVLHLGKFTHDGLDLPGLGLGAFQRRANRCVEVERGLGEIGLGHKLGAQQRHHDDADDENHQCQAQGSQLVYQRPAQDALVAVAEFFCRAVKPAGDAANGPVIQRA